MTEENEMGLFSKAVPEPPPYTGKDALRELTRVRGKIPVKLRVAGCRDVEARFVDLADHLTSSPS